MGRETVAWNQKVSSWGLTTQPWTPSQAEARLLVRKEGRRGSKEGDKWGSCKNQILLSSRGRIYFYTGCCCSSPTPHTPHPEGCVLHREPCCWWLDLRGNNQGNRASRVSVAVVVVLSKRACGNTQSGRCWLFVTLVFNERTPLCLWLLRLRYNIHSLTVCGRAKVTRHFSI